MPSATDSQEPAQWKCFDQCEIVGHEFNLWVFSNLPIGILVNYSWYQYCRPFVSSTVTEKVAKGAWTLM